MKLQVNRCVFLVVLLMLGAPSVGQVSIDVPGNRNLWLAGMPPGSVAGGDVAPQQSPAQVIGIPISSSLPLYFTAIGIADSCPLPRVCYPVGPEGSLANFICKEHGPDNGIAIVCAPFVSLIGVFLNEQLPIASPTPSGFDFRNFPGLDFSTLAPSLKQPFFIGDGRNIESVPQQFTPPAGATRLFLGIMEGKGWADNQGGYRVTVSCVGGRVLPPDPPPCIGGTRTLTCTAYGTGPFTYQWRRLGVPLNDGPIGPGSVASGTRTPDLTLQNITYHDAGVYDCIISSPCAPLGTLSNPAILDVHCECATTTVLAGLIDGFVLPREDAIPSSLLEASMSIENDRPLIEFDQVPGFTSGIATGRALAHTFAALPTDIVDGSLTIRVHAGGTNQQNAEGTDRVRLGFAQGGNPWWAWSRYFGTGNPTDAFFPGLAWRLHSDRTFTLDLAALPRASQDGGGYLNLLPRLRTFRRLDVVVSDDSGADFAELRYRHANGRKVQVVTEQPESLTATLGQRVYFRVAANPAAGSFTYQWRRNSIPLSDDTRVVGSTGSMLMINSVRASDRGRYDCVLLGANSCLPAGQLPSRSATLEICLADVDDGSGSGVADGGVTVEDLLYFLAQYSFGSLRADLDNGGGTGTPDGGVTIDDLLFFLDRYAAGC